MVENRVCIFGFNNIDNFLYIFILSEPGEPVHILSIAVRGIEDMDDNQMAHLFGSFCKQFREDLYNHRIRRITFAALKK